MDGWLIDRWVGVSLKDLSQQLQTVSDERENPNPNPPLRTTGKSVEAQAKSQHHHEGGIRPHKITASKTKHELLNNELLTARSTKDSIMVPMKRLAYKVAVKQGL